MLGLNLKHVKVAPGKSGISAAEQKHTCWTVWLINLLVTQWGINDHGNIGLTHALIFNLNNEYRIALTSIYLPAMKS